MTGQERILCALRGERPDTVPWAPNIQQWFYANKLHGTLPDDVAHCRNPIEVLQWLGAEVITRWDGQIKGRGFPGENTRFSACKLTVEFDGPAPADPQVTAFNTYTKGNRIHRTLETPCGTLTQTWRFTEESCADFEERFWWKDFEKEFDAVRAFVEDRHYDYDLSDYEKTRDRVGTHGFVMQEIPECPLKMMHWLCGPERATYMIMDHGERLAELFAIHTRKTLEFVEHLLRHTNVQLLISNDNLDSMLFPPYFFEQYLKDHYRRVADLIHSAGRSFWVHSCGNNYDLAPYIKESGIDCMEGLTHPPLGNFPLHMAHEVIGPDFVVEGGNSCHEQEIFDDTGPQVIRDYTADLFKRMGDNPHFIYASSCNTSPRTPWRNMLAMRDSARDLGRAL